MRGELQAELDGGGQGGCDRGVPRVGPPGAVVKQEVGAGDAGKQYLVVGRGVLGREQIARDRADEGLGVAAIGRRRQIIRDHLHLGVRIPAVDLP